MKFEMTPKRRMDAAFWLGSIQAILSMVLFQYWQSDDPVTAVASIALIVAWLAIGVVYIQNALAFSKETLWMTIKNPAKVTMEDGAIKYQHHVRPNRPPPMASIPKPPPKPPGRSIKEGEQPPKPYGYR